MCNNEIRQAAKENGVFLYRLADRLGCSESTVNRLLRFELPDDKKKDLLELIKEIGKENN